MKKPAALRLLVPVAVVALAALASGVSAQPYPAKPIRLVVPFPPGGGVDVTARIISDKVGQSLGQPIVIENRSGAGGAIAEEYVSKAAPDGYTLLYCVCSDMITRKHIVKRVTVDALKDLTPIATAIMSVNIVAAGPGSRITTLKELVEEAKRNPGKMSWGAGGIGSYHHLIAELMKQHGLQLVYVPYKGLAPAMTALVSGETEIGLTNFAVALPHMKDGKVKALGVFEASRYPGAPEVPSVGEELRGFRAPPSWFGFFGPAGMPQPVVLRLNGEVARALEHPEVSGRIRAAYLNVLVTPADQLRAFILETADTFGKIVKAANIQPTE